MATTPNNANDLSYQAEVDTKAFDAYSKAFQRNIMIAR
jgi:hypothetical protein